MKRRKMQYQWAIRISFVTLILAIFMSIISEALLNSFSLIPAFLTLVLIVLIGVTSDTIGIAVAAAIEKPFHSMAAQQIPHARHAVFLVRNAGPVSNFCNDVIGDIAGIISGAAIPVIVLQVIALDIPVLDKAIVSVTLSGFVAALTVGGKAVGKEIALTYWKEIVTFVARVLYFAEHRLKVRVVPAHGIKKIRKNAKKKGRSSS